MWNTFKYTALSTVRERSVILWVILFPLILATLFNVMFKGMDETAFNLPTIPVAIVDNSEGGSGDSFDATMDALSKAEGDEDPLLAPVYVKDADEAFQKLKGGETIGTITLDADGWPSLALSPGAGDVGVSMEQVKRTVLAVVL